MSRVWRLSKDKKDITTIMNLQKWAKDDTSRPGMTPSIVRWLNLRIHDPDFKLLETHFLLDEYAILENKDGNFSIQFLLDKSMLENEDEEEILPEEEKKETYYSCGEEMEKIKEELNKIKEQDERLKKELEKSSEGEKKN